MTMTIAALTISVVLLVCVEHRQHRRDMRLIRSLLKLASQQAELIELQTQQRDDAVDEGDVVIVYGHPN